MAETAINVVLSKFGELATREAAVLLQVGGDIMQLRDRLEWLQAFIRDADQKRRAGTDGLTRVWVRQTRDVAFAAEDALDEFFHKVDLESQGYDSWNNRLMIRYLTGWWTQITVRHGLSGKIRSITTKLEGISENRKQYNIDHTPSSIWTSSTTSLSPRDYPVMDVRKYVEDNLCKLGNLLFKKNPGEKVLISVLGESGSGKNTLVDFVYKDIRFKAFDCSIWYSMPPDSSAQDLLKQVYDRAYEMINGQKPDPTSEVEVESSDIDSAGKLLDLLRGKRYLVVLSGISSKSLLNCMWASLPDDSKGSRVVLILESAYYDVAQHGAVFLNKSLEQKETILWLRRWDEERSAGLFQELLGAEGGGVTKVTKEDKHYLYAMTDGHPLAIVVLAGLLRHKEPAEREALMKQLNPANLNDEKAKRMPAIERILSASYDDLPQDLKSCFLYFAAYSKNITQPVESIVRMWTAEGFIRRRKGKTPEDLGRMYVRELVSRCLVKGVRKKDVGSSEKVLVHSRILEFLQSEARQASFVEVHDRCDVLEPASVRRLSIQDDGNGYTPSVTKFPNLRSFICRVEDEEEEGQNGGGTSTFTWCFSMLPCLGVGEAGVNRCHDINFLCQSKFLRLISVEGLNLEELPDEIGDMIHLRYIRVHCRRLKKLPSSIRKLLNLQTLDIMTTEVEEIHPMFWTIKALRHVLAETLTLPESVEEELGDLQTLHGVKPAQGQWHKDNCPLHRATKLRWLELHGLEAGKHGAALADALRKMHLLVHLKLQGDMIPSCVFTARSLRCLETMVLQGKVMWNGIQPDIHVLHVRPNLVQLKLEVPSLTGDGVKVLARLTSLLHLVLHVKEDAPQEGLVIPDAAFPNLEEFCFRYEVPCLMFQASQRSKPMPRVRTLTIECSAQGKRHGDGNVLDGIEHLGGLLGVQVSICDKDYFNRLPPLIPSPHSSARSQVEQIPRWDKESLKAVLMEAIKKHPRYHEDRPSPDANKPNPDANKPSLDTDKPSLDADKPSPDANKLSPDEPSLDANKPSPNEPSLDVDNPSPDANKPSPDEPSLDADKSSPYANKPSPNEPSLDANNPSPDVNKPSPDANQQNSDAIKSSPGDKNPSLCVIIKFLG